jgi:hypothetical protein
MFAFLFCFFAGASTMLEMFDLNVSPINIDDYEPESISHCLGIANSDPPTTLSEAPVSLEDIWFP